MLVGKYGIDLKECACVGDQIFTDVWAADMLGVKSFLVLPINDVKTLFNKFKRLMEKPFVRAYKRKCKMQTKTFD
jgi:predicted HAD superfamily phosphohydrolase YqeG